MLDLQLDDLSGGSDRVLVASHLTKRFDSLTAVNDMSLGLYKGKCLTLLGPNGAGKTTLVEMLEGLTPPDQGDIQIFGVPFNAKTKRSVLENVGVLLQETQLYRKLTVRETLQLFASFYDNAADPDEVIAKLALQEKANTRLQHLSGGMRQRVYLGCALINRPKILFLDEPTTGLDPESRRSIWQIIEGLKKDGCAILLTTHYMEEAEHLADEVMMVLKGKTIFKGQTKELLRTHAQQSPIELSYRASKETQKKLQSAGLGVIREVGFDEYVMDVKGMEVANLVRKVSEFDLQIMEVKVLTPSLEDIYLKLTGEAILE